MRCMLKNGFIIIYIIINLNIYTDLSHKNIGINRVNRSNPELATKGDATGDNPLQDAEKAVSLQCQK